MTLMTFKEAEAALSAFRTAFEGEIFDGCRGPLSQLKLAIAGFQTLTPNSKRFDPAEYKLARETLELAGLMSIRCDDLAGFERCVTQLKVLYFDLADKAAEANVSSREEDTCAILGLYLLYLLATDRTGEFHTELELIPMNLMSSPHVVMATTLDSQVMSGYYNAVLDAAEGVSQLVPDKVSLYAKVIMKELVATMRHKVAESLERAYDRISVVMAAKLLKLTPAELPDFCREENNRKAKEITDKLNMNTGDMSTPVLSALRLRLSIHWVISGDMLEFREGVSGPEDVHAYDMLRNAIGYATDMERII